VQSQPTRPTVSGLHKKQRGQEVEGGDCAALLHSGETSPGVLHPALEPSAQERHGPVGAGPEEATKIIRWMKTLSCEERLRELVRREGSRKTLLQSFSAEGILDTLS